MNTADVPSAAASFYNKRLVKAWLIWSLVWLTVFPLVGLLVSIKFN
ncbi:MAG TPA: hypothetical protein VKC56_08415 [Gallionellaceae bacterium]|nr:hypothetical protein [Gallionellaceae bacterium]